jgi:hypothetical protein
MRLNYFWLGESSGSLDRGISKIVHYELHINSVNSTWRWLQDWEIKQEESGRKSGLVTLKAMSLATKLGANTMTEALL